MKEKTMKAPRHKEKTKSNSCGYCTCIFIGFILVVFGLTAVNLHQFVFRYRYHDLKGLGERSLRHLSDDLNTLLCHAYRVTPLEPANVFLMEGKVKVDRRHKITTKRTTNELVPNSDFLKNAFYLLEGSHIHVNGCKADRLFHDFDTAELLLFKGDRAWKRWSEGKCGDCPLKRITIQADDLCSVTSIHLSHTVRKSDTFYVALYKEDAHFSGFKADATIRRTTYDLKHIREACYATVDCYLNLTYGKTLDVVVQFPDDAIFSSFGTECKYRTMLWLILFLFLPGCLISFSLCCCCCCACATKDGKAKCHRGKGKLANVQSASTADLLANEYPPDYQSIVKPHTIQNV